MRIARSFRRGRGPGPKRNVLFPAPNETPRSNGISPPPKKEKKTERKEEHYPGVEWDNIANSGYTPKQSKSPGLNGIYRQYGHRINCILRLPILVSI